MAAPPLHHHSMPMENPNRLSNDEVRTIKNPPLPSAMVAGDCSSTSSYSNGCSSSSPPFHANGKP
ncbi:hypothetical protein LOK49_LG05G03138 [Camellia lanceoleosa]|uniref:Uncharacterized protein n=1 Tax=Camellia lanceoleosa TaxID=1840588 RepID=A0ACC0HPQ2_9ERIC|nr:hypothetical protein LOK49_LG05G03138 [Camellia lanceoleosa]